MALNLFSFVDEPFTVNAKINEQKLYEISYEHARLGDALVDLELEHIQRILDKIESDPEPDSIKRPEKELWELTYESTVKGRRTGLGLTALGDTLAALGMEYDSEEGLKMTEIIMKTKMRAELDCLIDLAILRGSFSGWNPKLENTYSENGRLPSCGENLFYQFIWDEFFEQAKKMEKFGRRSVSWSTVAPTGSVSILTQTSSGCEPIFQPFYTRRKKINPGEDGVRVDFVDDVGDSWQEFFVLHPKFKEFIVQENNGRDVVSNLEKEELEKWFNVSPWFGSIANDIDWVKRNEMQSVLQKYTSNAISSTINLPSTVTEEEVATIYFDGWKKGLKGQTVYVDGSRSGVLVTNTEKKEKFTQTTAPKRPKALPCEVHKSTTGGKKWLVIVGLLDGKPYEVFCIDDNNEISKNISKGQLVKISRGRYKLEVGDLKIEGVSSQMTDEQEATTRMISTSLRHGADIKFVAEQLSKTKGFMTSFSKSIARVLKKFIKDGEKSALTCDSCGSEDVIYEEGCNKCLSCGSSACS